MILRSKKQSMKHLFFIAWIFVSITFASYLLCSQVPSIPDSPAPAQIVDSSPQPAVGDYFVHEEEDDDDEYDEDEEENDAIEEQQDMQQAANQPLAFLNSSPVINKIIINGNKHISEQAILNRVSFHVGETLTMEKLKKTGPIIRNLYHDLKRFRSVDIKAEPLPNNMVNIHLNLIEKKPLKQIIFQGNKVYNQKELTEKLKLEDVPALDPEEVTSLVIKIKKLYAERGYTHTEIATKFDVDENDKATITFTITEGKQSLVKRINFIGNDHVSSKQLRSILYTHEDWILGFLDKSGTYIKERLEGDKYALEQYYQNHGYMNAKVIGIATDTDPETGHYALTFEIQEGDIYTINEVKASGNDIIPDEILVNSINIRPGQLFSRERVMDAIKSLEFIWGDLGYLFAHVEPSITPNDDTKTVSIAFFSELGKQIFLDKLVIKGNKKTRDKVVRRLIPMQEGDLLINRFMEDAKNRIEGLGYFDQREGVNWKINRIGEDKAQLDLMLKETKTGHAGFNLGFNGSEKSIRSPITGASLELNVSDTNIQGTGIRGNLMGRFSHEDVSFLFNLTQPWLFDKPILGALDLYHKRLAYEEFRQTRAVNEIHTGGGLTGGFVANYRYLPLLRDTFVRGSFTVDRVHYQPDPKASIVGISPQEHPEQFALATTEYDRVLSQEFQKGDYASLSLHLGQDRKNHPLMPSRGYAWTCKSQVAFNGFNSNIGFWKLDLDAHWYTPLINNRDLVFHLHGYAGLAHPFKNKIAPYRELFHIGGPATVRGFLFGQIGPQFGVASTEGAIIGDSIGGQNAMVINAELLFPIASDFSMRGVLFYDGGTGWNNPYADNISPQFLFNNHFSYRHAVGFGIRLTSPMPIKIDWGFKLDPRKGESSHEVHFNMSYDWN